MNHDISVVIPTIDRPKDLKIAMDSLSRQTYFPREVIIVDQSANGETKKLLSGLSMPFDVRYVHTEDRSSSRARNRGAEDAAGDLVCFLDDDVILDKDYFRFVNETFTAYPALNGLTGRIVNLESKYSGLFKKSGVMLLRLINLAFANERLKQFGIKGVFSVSSYVFVPKKILFGCEWLSSCNCTYRKETFEQFLFEPKFEKYSYREDVDLSNRIFRRYPNTLAFNPVMTLVHNQSPESRIPNAEKLRMKYVYFMYVYLKTHKAGFEFWWSTAGYVINRFLLSLSEFNMRRFFAEMEALSFALKHLDRIKKGDVSYSSW